MTLGEGYAFLGCMFAGVLGVMDRGVPWTAMFWP
jgi:hypothetical protein